MYLIHIQRHQKPYTFEKRTYVTDMLRFFQTSILVQVFAGFYNACPPAEEGKPYNISVSFINNLTQPFETAFLRSKIPISKCVFNIKCFDGNVTRSMTVIRSSNKNLYSNTLTIKYITRNDANVWSLKYLGQASLRYKYPLLTCQLNTFTKGENLTCRDQMVNNVIKVHCRIVNIYPEAKGLMLVTLAESTSSEISLNCSHEISNMEVVYFTSTCEGEASIIDEHFRHHGDFIVSIYPNITGDAVDRRLGINITLNNYKSANDNHVWFNYNNNTTNNEDRTIVSDASLSSKVVIWQSTPLNDELHSTFTTQLAPIVLGVSVVMSIAIMTLLIVCFRKKLCVINSLTSVTIRTGDRKETLKRPCSHVYESVEELYALTDTKDDATYVNCKVLTSESACSFHNLHNDYITPNEVEVTCQTADADSGGYITLIADQ